MSETHKVKLSWKRPANVEYPKVWHTFKARDLNSDELVEYRIEDLPLSSKDDVLEHLQKIFIADEPICEVFGGKDDPAYIDDCKFSWNIIIDQNVALVCFKSGSDEIVGTNMTYVDSKQDNFMENCAKQLKSQNARNAVQVSHLLYENFDPFEHYGVNEFLASFGLTVDPKYRGRGIGDQFLATRKRLCKEFGLKFSQGLFSSDFSNRNADRAGFITNVAIKYEDVVKSHPQFEVLKNIKSQQMTIKTLMS